MPAQNIRSRLACPISAFRSFFLSPQKYVRDQLYRAFHPLHFVRHLLPNVARLSLPFSLFPSRMTVDIIRGRTCDTSRYILAKQDQKERKNRTFALLSMNIFSPFRARSTLVERGEEGGDWRWIVIAVGDSLYLNHKFADRYRPYSCFQFHEASSARAINEY